MVGGRYDRKIVCAVDYPGFRDPFFYQYAGAVALPVAETITIDKVLIGIDHVMKGHAEKYAHDEEACLYEMRETRRKMLDRIDEYVHGIEVIIRCRTKSVCLNSIP